MCDIIQGVVSYIPNDPDDESRQRHSQLLLTRFSTVTVEQWFVLGCSRMAMALLDLSALYDSSLLTEVDRRARSVAGALMFFRVRISHQAPTVLRFRFIGMHMICYNCAVRINPTTPISHVVTAAMASRLADFRKGTDSDIEELSTHYQLFSKHCAHMTVRDWLHRQLSNSATAASVFTDMLQDEIQRSLCTWCGIHECSYGSSCVSVPNLCKRESKPCVVIATFEYRVYCRWLLLNLGLPTTHVHCIVIVPVGFFQCE
jgi:hypothetical protein